jgi:dynein heavy chain
MSLVFFEDAMHHILRICRTLRQPRGNIMLIGVGGSGKQSLTRLSSYMYDMKFRMIEMKKDYKISDFRDLMKQLMFATGGVDN